MLVSTSIFDVLPLRVLPPPVPPVRFFFVIFFVISTSPSKSVIASLDAAAAADACPVNQNIECDIDKNKDIIPFFWAEMVLVLIWIWILVSKFQ